MQKSIPVRHPRILPLFLTHTRLRSHRPQPPTPPPTHSNTQNKHTVSTQHSTRCNNFRGMVSMWRGCGKELEGKWKPGRGDALQLLTHWRLVISHAASSGIGVSHCELMGTCVFRVPRAASYPVQRCGKRTFCWGEARSHPGTQQTRSQPRFQFHQLSLVCAKRKKKKLKKGFVVNPDLN